MFGWARSLFSWGTSPTEHNDDEEKVSTKECEEIHQNDDGISQPQIGKEKPEKSVNEGEKEATSSEPIISAQKIDGHNGKTKNNHEVLAGKSSKSHSYDKGGAFMQCKVLADQANIGRKKILPDVTVVKNESHCTLYQIGFSDVKKDEASRIATMSIGTENLNYPAPGRVLMIVGATGSGKSTLINGMTNYIFGVEWGDPFRYVLIHDEGARSQTESQTSWITAYTFHKTEYSTIPYTLTIIDTPGFGDTRGVKRDKEIANQIKELFTNCKIHVVDQLHAIGFVAASSAVRLTPTQKYIFDATLSIFGNDIANNIVLFATFADGKNPPVYDAVKEAKVPHRKAFKFNNSALYSVMSAPPGDNSDMFDQLFWVMGNTSFQTFFNEFITMEARSLHLTREVLKERERLEATVRGLQPQIKKGLYQIETLKQTTATLQNHESQINANKDFKYTVTVQQQRQVALKPGEIITTCLSCHLTCHFPCGILSDADKRGCAAMDSNGNCRICPGKCIWNQHYNTPYKYEIELVEIEKTYEDLKKKYQCAEEGKNQVESLIKQIEDELQELTDTVYHMIDEARQSNERLKEIALKPNPMTEIEYIDLLIQSEKQSGQSGFLERIKALEEIREQAAILSKVTKEEQQKLQKKGWRDSFAKFKFWQA